jgi:ERCC4-related helicase
MHYGDLFSFRDFNLVVLDECHYARGNRQYKIIMDKWYHTLPHDQRPRILGLTASPLVNVKYTHTDDQLRQMLISLEQTLDAHLVTWSDEDESVANERQVAFVGPAEPSPPLDFPSHDRCGIHPCRTRELNQLRVLYKDLGPLPVYLYVRDCAKEVSCNEYEKETSQQFQCLLNHLDAILDYCQLQMRQSSEGRSDKLVKLENLLKEQLAGRDLSVGLVFVQRRITAKALHAYFHREECMDWENEVTKSKEDHFLLSSAEDSTRKCVKTVADQFEDSDADPAMAFIQFASKRPRIEETGQFAYSTAIEPQSFCRPNRSLVAQSCNIDATNPSNQRLNKIRCGVLIRQASQAFKRYGNESPTGCDPQEEVLKQERSIRDTLCALRNQEINVLLATSLVEEGVDVQACSFVVAFDAASSVKAYVQMKGRARQKDAHFFLFFEGGNLDLATPSPSEIADRRTTDP